MDEAVGVANRGIDEDDGSADAEVADFLPGFVLDVNRFNVVLRKEEPTDGVATGPDGFAGNVQSSAPIRKGQRGGFESDLRRGAIFVPPMAAALDLNGVDPAAEEPLFLLAFANSNLLLFSLFSLSI